MAKRIHGCGTNRLTCDWCGLRMNKHDFIRKVVDGSGYNFCSAKCERLVRSSKGSRLRGVAYVPGTSAHHRLKCDWCRKPVSRKTCRRKIIIGGLYSFCSAACENRLRRY